MATASYSILKAKLELRLLIFTTAGVLLLQCSKINLLPNRKSHRIRDELISTLLPHSAHWLAVSGTAVADRLFDVRSDLPAPGTEQAPGIEHIWPGAFHRKAPPGTVQVVTKLLDLWLSTKEGLRGLPKGTKSSPVPSVVSFAARVR